MYKKISLLLLLLSLALAWFCYGAYQQNTAIKKGALQQFLFNQSSIEIYLDKVIENHNDASKVISYLAKATSFMDQNTNIVANGALYLGSYMSIPQEFFLINRDKGTIVYHAFEEASKGPLKEETVSSLIVYRDNIAIITEGIDLEQVPSMSLKEIYTILEDISNNLID